MHYLKILWVQLLHLNVTPEITLSISRRDIPSYHVQLEKSHGIKTMTGVMRKSLK